MREVFIQAIRDEPDDDAPRLVYADWLEDQGESARAEFIRVQCELTRGVRDRGRSLELLRRLRQLVLLHREEWLGGLARWAPDAIFERGFIDRVALRASTFLEHAGEILAEHPINRVALREAAEEIRDLAACPDLAHLHTLELLDSSLTDARAAALAASPWFERLRALVLSRSSIGGAGVRALAAAAHLRRLETLLLDGNRLGDGGAEALACSPNLARLTRLDLSRNEVTDRGAAMLAGSPHLARLTSLRLAHNRLTPAGVAALAESPHLAGLTVLDVSANSFDHRAGARLRRRFGSRLLC
jgi:uncharacterized protein (TIGR02996 family)